MITDEYGTGRVIKAHERSSYNRPLLEASERCGCFHCLSIYPPADIKEWIERGLVRGKFKVHETALCPKCGIDSVIDDKSGFPLDEKFLTAMRQHWFKNRSAK